MRNLYITRDPLKVLFIIFVLIGIGGQVLSYAFPGLLYTSLFVYYSNIWNFLFLFVELASITYIVYGAVRIFTAKPDKEKRKGIQILIRGIMWLILTFLVY